MHKAYLYFFEYEYMAPLFKIFIIHFQDHGH